MNRFEFIENLKDNIKYVKKHHPHLLDEYRDGVRNVSLEAVNSTSYSEECFQQEYKVVMDE